VVCLKKLLVLFLIILCFNLPFSVSALGNSAKAAILINADTGEVIFEKNADERLPMASTTKVMTALLLCENANLQEEITVTDQMVRVEGSSMGLLGGDRVTFHDLLYGMMLASGNDAANVTAYSLGGTVDAFVKKMNEKAASLGMKNTNFATPSGLDDTEHYSTARDMAILTRSALENKDFAEAVATEKAVLCFGNPPYRRTLTNHNKLLGNFEGAIGVKTGFTKKSGRCLISAAERDGKRVIAVTLCDSNDWQNHKEMLEYGLSAIKLTQIKPQTEEITIPVVNGQKDTITVKIAPLSFSSLDDSNFSYEVRLPKFVYAPIKKDEPIGNVIYKKNDTVIATVELYSQTEIAYNYENNNFYNAFKENIKYIFKNYLGEINEG